LVDQGYYYEVVQKLPWQNDDSIKSGYDMSSKETQDAWLKHILAKN
jgi:hypothetical protein